jgi:uncharacterized protein
VDRRPGHTTYLNIVFIIMAVALVAPFFRSGGGAMLKMMGGGPEAAGDQHTGHPGQAGHAGHVGHRGVTDL